MTNVNHYSHWIIIVPLGKVRPKGKPCFCNPWELYLNGKSKSLRDCVVETTLDVIGVGISLGLQVLVI